MLKRKLNLLAWPFVFGVLLGGCGRRAVPAEATPLGLPPDVAQAARREVSSAVDVPVGEIAIVRANRVDWADTCLELGDPDEEVCGQAITPGWRVILEAGGTEYEAHTDLSADVVRLKEP
jgi:hypothetical protein